MNIKFFLSKITFRNRDIADLKAAFDYNEIRIKNIEKTTDNKTHLSKNTQYNLALKLRERLHSELESRMLLLEKHL